MKVFKISAVLLATLILIAGCGDKETENVTENPVIDLTEYKEKGQQLASSTQKVLASNLISAIEEKGAEHALEFCNIRAIPLTDSMSTALNAHIKRVTNQPRNADNRANEKELKYIKEANEKLQDSLEITPKVFQNNGKVTAYYPIVTNQLCMQCHGQEGQDIKESTLAKINSLYQDDEATGYTVGEIRGLWVVEMETE